jgi:OOP family OmpA-OmpF porin
VTGRRLTLAISVAALLCAATAARAQNPDVLSVPETPWWWHPPAVRLSPPPARQATRQVLPGDLLFDSGEAKLVAAADADLSVVLATVRARQPAEIRITGYTDADGTAEYNLTLSRRRARAVARYLVTRGVPRRQIKVIGRGESDPVASNDSRAGKRENRRVVIELLGRGTASGG